MLLRPILSMLGGYFSDSVSMLADQLTAHSQKPGECFLCSALTLPGEAGSVIDEEIADPLRSWRPCKNANSDSAATASKID